MSQPQVRPSPDGDRGQTAAVAPPSTRRGDLDLLRALVVAGLVFFHSAVIFGPGEFPVKAAREYPVAAVFIAFGATWGMPLLFVVSGMGIWYSLRSRSPWAFAQERLRRLLVPLVVGVLAIVPLQVYLGLRRAGDTSSYARFYRRWLDVRLSPDVPFVVQAARPDGVFQSGHLWFLVCLLAFSLLLLPGLAFLRRPGGRRVVERLAGVLTRPGAVFLLALPLVALEVPLGSEVGLAAWNRYSYAVFLVYGYLTAADPRIGTAFERHWRPGLALAVVLFAAGGAVYAAADAHGDPFVDTNLASVVFRVLKTVDGWLWVIAILGAARSGLARGPKAMATRASAGGSAGGGILGRLGRYANEAVLPFYVLHETVIVAVAYVVLTWRIGAGPQYGLIVLASLAATLFLYDLGVRRTRLTRLLFGLKPIPSSQPTKAS
jgi:surface polysaccharide O-acyltransferase-like enzyme